MKGKSKRAKLYHSVHVDAVLRLLGVLHDVLFGEFCYHRCLHHFYTSIAIEKSLYYPSDRHSTKILLVLLLLWMLLLLFILLLLLLLLLLFVLVLNPGAF